MFVWAVGGGEGQTDRQTDRKDEKGGGAIRKGTEVSLFKRRVAVWYPAGDGFQGSLPASCVPLCQSVQGTEISQPPPALPYSVTTQERVKKLPD